MPELWMPGAARHDLGDHALTDQRYPPKAIAHITWDRNATASAPRPWVPYENLVSYFTGTGRNSAPHIIWDPFSGRVAQLYPATSRSKSVVDVPGNTMTNRAGKVVLQIEAVFFPYCSYNGTVYARLADTPCAGWERLRSWVHSWGVPDVWPMGRPTSFVPNRNELIWASTPGWYAHSQVPENTHQDPGSWPAFTSSRVPPTPTRPTVSLAHIIAAAKSDPPAEQGHTTYRDEARIVEQALADQGLLESAWVDGSFGTRTVTAYAAWQRRLGYTGDAADGIPGRTSLTRLGDAQNFTVTT